MIKISLLPTRVGLILFTLSVLFPLTAAEKVPWPKALFGDPGENLQKLRDQLDQELKENGGDTNKPAVALASAMLGSAASQTGNHEEAVKYLEAGLKTLSEGAWKDVELRIIEYRLRLSLAKSLDKLDRTPEAIRTLESLVERTKQDLKKEPAPARAQIFGYGKNDSIALKDTLANEMWLVTLNQGLGVFQFEQKNWAAAEIALQEAGNFLERLDPAQAQRIAKMREISKQAASKQGKAIRPQLVGRSSNPYTFQIEGAKVFTPRQICSALARSHDFVLNSHPESAFEQFLSATRDCILRGYRSAGFPGPSVEMTWNESSARVVVTIVEGPRFRAGKIQIKYSDALTEATRRKLGADELRAFLTSTENFETNLNDRRDLAFIEISKKKQFLDSKAQEALNEAFPDQVNQANEDLLLSGFSHVASLNFKTKWQQGSWVDYDPGFTNFLGEILQSAFAEKSLFSPDFKITFSNDLESGTSDLLVSIQSEGRPFQLGKIAITGNQLNSKEELLKFLELKEGTALKGAWLEDLKRKLYQSGRFVGWTLAPLKAPDDRQDQIDLMILVEEVWHAPPLSEDLTPEQDALLRAIDWINGKAGTKEDFVFNLAIKHPSGPLALRLALNSENIALSISGLDQEIHLFMTNDEEVEVFTLNENGSFHAKTQIDASRFLAYFNLLSQPQSSPFSKTGSIDLGLGFLSGGAKPGILIDPSAALEIDTLRPVIKNGILSLQRGPMTFRFEAATGRFITMKIEGSENLLLSPVIAKMEAGAVLRLQTELRKKIDKTENWLTDKKGPALAIHGLFHGWELFQLFGEDDALSLSPQDFISRARQRANRREPLATFLGEITSALWNVKATGVNQDENNEFLIPDDESKLRENANSGIVTTLLVKLGVFDTCARHLEPGSWPEKIMRATMSVMDGNPVHLERTRERLLADEKMGPIGFLVCAQLLSKVGHPGAFDFLAKAEENLTERGFEKDWRILLSSPAGFDGIGWKILEAFQKLDGPEIDLILPIKSSLLHELAIKAAKVTPLNKFTLLRPSMNTFWKEDVRNLVRQGLISVRKKLLARWDPEKTAAVVNGIGIPRAAVNLERLTGGATPTNILGMNQLEQCIGSMLLAQEIWKTGQAPIRAAVEKKAEAFIASLGGWEKAQQLGFSRKGFSFWVSVMMSQNAEVERLFQGKLISEKEARQYFESAPALKNQNSVHAHLITLKVDNNLNAQQKKAAEIRQRIEAATRGKLFKQKALKEAFAKEAREHSMDPFSQKGGDLGWQKESEFPGPLAAEMARLEIGVLSEVIKVELAGQRAVSFMITLPEARRPVPFEQLAREAVLGAYFDRLFSKAQIYRLPKLKPIDPNQKPPENKALKNLELAIEQMMAEVDIAAKFPGFNKGQEEHPFAKLPPAERATRGADQGRPDDLYRLGTYAERGISPRKNGMPEALKLYREAAEKGEANAMLRLAELHRIGRGVERDPEKYREWRDRGYKALDQQ